MKNLPDESIAYALLRFAFGINFFGHGLVRIIGGPANFAAVTVKGFEKSLLPVAMAQPFLTVLPFLELALGLSLILGLVSRWAYILGALLICALTFGSAMQSNWSAVSIQLLYSVVFFILLFLRRYNSLSLDTLLTHSSSNKIA